jgi:hypothetical protein
MAKLTWDTTGDRFFETGLDRGVLYVMNNGKYGTGVAWNGLTSVSESPEGAELTELWADGIKYANMRSAEDMKATVEAYTYPEEFEVCDGTASLAEGVTIGQQKRATFALCYRTLVGNDQDGTDHGYKIHIIYGATASPSEKQYQTVNDSPDAITFSWEMSTTPVNVTGFDKPTALVVIDSTKVSTENLKKIEDKLYGTESEEATVLLPDEIKTLLGA